ncbi:MAG: lasso peptide biosynthesis protein [Lachnospiraceae bacterium]|nr:lasso peptide biosynthesis protein [Lachnospiraceae bacterium]
MSSLPGENSPDTTLGVPQVSDGPGSSEAPETGTQETETPEKTNSPQETMAESTPAAEEPSPSPEMVVGTRSNTPQCLTPTADGTEETHNDISSIDYSNASDGYVMAVYTGTNSKVKMQIKSPNGVTYTYNLTGSDYEAFPLSSGNGSYEITILENVGGTSYIICLTTTISVSLTSEFSPYLYPNQYCSFNASSKTVAKAKELAEPANSDLDVVTNVYNYIIENITYDYDKASTVPSGYVPNVDAILASGTGICLDYAAVMTSMLRSQRIPTRLEVGYAGDAYHAWISTYISDIGWVNGIVEFDGQSWELMDPTFAASNSESTLKEFIGEGSNYVVKYMY